MGRTAGPSSGEHQGAFSPGPHHKPSGAWQTVQFLQLSKLGNSQPTARVPKFFYYFRQLGAQVLNHTLGRAGVRQLPSPSGRCHPAPAPRVPSRDTPSRDTPRWPHPAGTQPGARSQSLQSWTPCLAATLHTHRAGEASDQDGQTDAA